jgi:hypothetical protein
MIVPKFWAEGRVRERVDGKQVTVHRFGWSDASLADAEAMAAQRAREALDRINRGEKLLRREPKLSYNGAEGVPIREEILGRHGAAVITRNLYGARCLNTPNVLFADIDFEQELPRTFGCALMVLFLIVAGWIGMANHSVFLGAFCGVIALFFGYRTASFCHRTYLKISGGSEQLARKRLAAFLRKHPDWHLRLYRTPAGFRVLVMHHLYQPDEPVVAEFFQALGTDPVYVQMCLRQKCFRARLTPKPWRIGISQHMRPRPGIWPVSPERLPERTRWIEAYEAAARTYAACEFLEALGQSAVHATALSVQQIHDEVSRATSGLKIA